MPTKTTILLENIFTEAPAGDSSFRVGDKKKGAGYHKNNDGVHTVVYSLNSFIGTIKIQGTLAEYPGEDDWVDVEFTDATTEIAGDSTLYGAADSTDYINSKSFVGKFKWIRAVYNVQNGRIVQIRFNH